MDLLPIEIKVNIEGRVDDALSALGGPEGQALKRLIYFAEDHRAVAGGSGGRLLLDSGVIIRIRSGDTPDELTVKRRPVHKKDLVEPFTHPFEETSFEYRVEEDWSGDRHVLAASAVGTHPQGSLLGAVAPGADAAAPLDDRQRQFLAECAPSVELDGLVALGPIDSTKFDDLPVDDLKVDLEHWAVAGLDFLEASIRVKPKDDEEADDFEERAERKQRKLESALRERGLTISQQLDNKTRRVITALTARNH
ncbi:hypothetical protein ACFVHB_04390 [Kitasatospora sp. NPDC127111]|uniref:hypothetical protein n=1 Tax=Kitasatospora sp. NPDC127111 TaxID=3345363 RepID=UPI00362B4777